eukprot:CAMPEP_0198200308 /NCGR_PEP_ID=MMETSP1445-20131203/3345_1 /TAXON_ID=36898 /ORGANISM="Pyramimonas sp., Strain CCMP2087" /LENGTH=517 /DNA_ID=CAMNT_0043870333 /DNA_START=290 /DNA_END=1843 /DNA_ORIENTATION=+
MHQDPEAEKALFAKFPQLVMQLGLKDSVLPRCSDDGHCGLYETSLLGWEDHRQKTCPILGKYAETPAASFPSCCSPNNAPYVGRTTADDFLKKLAEVTSSGAKQNEPPCDPAGEGRCPPAVITIVGDSTMREVSYALDQWLLKNMQGWECAVGEVAEALHTKIPTASPTSSPGSSPKTELNITATGCHEKIPRYEPSAPLLRFLDYDVGSDILETCSKYPKVDWQLQSHHFGHARLYRPKAGGGGGVNNTRGVVLQFIRINSLHEGNWQQLGDIEWVQLPAEQMEKCQVAVLERIADLSDILIVNFGIHYKESPQMLSYYKRTVELTSETLVRVAATNHPSRVKKVGWCETRPQHFWTGDGTGDYDAANEESLRTQLAAINGVLEQGRDPPRPTNNTIAGFTDVLEKHAILSEGNASVPKDYMYMYPCSHDFARSTTPRDKTAAEVLSQYSDDARYGPAALRMMAVRELLLPHCDLKKGGKHENSDCTHYKELDSTPELEWLFRIYFDALYDDVLNK